MNLKRYYRLVLEMRLSLPHPVEYILKAVAGFNPVTTLNPFYFLKHKEVRTSKEHPPKRLLKGTISKRLKILFLFLVINSMLFWYFFYHPGDDRTKRREISSLSKGSLHSQPSLDALNPWPDLPSYLPWYGNETGPPRSCEGYFGNGFTQRIEVLEETPEPSGNVGSTKPDGWFRCFYSETLRSSICEGGNFRMNPEKILMSRGGEKLESVKGRSEEEELPKFQAGAFDMKVAGKSFGMALMDLELLDNYVKEADISVHPRMELVQSFRVAGANEFHCAEWVEEPTLFIVRFEYANLFHTTTDWYSAYVASRVIGLPGRPRVVFVDGHSEAPTMEEIWNALFTRVRYAKSFSSSVCFRHGIIIPLGYETPLFSGVREEINCDGTTADELKRQPNFRKTARLSEFGEMVRAALDFPVAGPNISRAGPSLTILFIRRENYVPHPRNGGNLENRLSNEEEVFNSVKIWASSYTGCKLSVTNGLFGHLKMRDQVKAVLEAKIIIGAHGGGLTHIMWALPDTVVVEIRTSNYKRPHFAFISRWKGLEYHSIEPPGSDVNPKVVTEKLYAIVKSLGC